MHREKRSLDANANDNDDINQPDRKRPALASVILEALKTNAILKLFTELEPSLRRIVSEEVDRALTKVGPPPSSITHRSVPKHRDGWEERNLKLQFRSKISLNLFTGGKLEGEQGARIDVELIDARTGDVVKNGPESVVKLDVVVLEGDFNNEDQESWTEEDFTYNLVKEREGKRPLLIGDLQVTLREGVGTLGELMFTDNSSWTRSRKFRLGLKVAAGHSVDSRIREAKTEPFTVKDQRGELYKKHYPPAPNDEVWRLEKIGKDGSFHKRLNDAGIDTVEAFLQLAVRDSQKMRHILGSGMSNKMWEVLIDHAKTCPLSEKFYSYSPEDVKDVSLIFNNVSGLQGVISCGQYFPLENLSADNKLMVTELAKKAYENWKNVIEFDCKSHKLNQIFDDTGNQHLTLQQQPSNPYLQQIACTTLSFPQDEQATKERNGVLSELNSHHRNYPTQMDNVLNMQQFQVPRNDNLKAHHPCQQSMSGFHSASMPKYGSCLDVDNFHSLEEMLQEEEMQHVLATLETSYPYHGLDDDGFQYLPGFDHQPNVNVDEPDSSNKALMGWLKLKSSLRWGIFVNKTAAQRRVRLIEIDN